MKQKYVKPNLEVTKLLTEDIINTSEPETKAEVFVNANDLF